MARDYLAIQSAGVVSERAFSSGGLTGMDCHNCLSLSLFQALQLLKAAYRSGDTSAADFVDEA